MPAEAEASLHIRIPESLYDEVLLFARKRKIFQTVRTGKIAGKQTIDIPNASEAVRTALTEFFEIQKVRTEEVGRDPDRME
jgi:hypothetical protein